MIKRTRRSVLDELRKIQHPKRWEGLTNRQMLEYRVTVGDVLDLMESIGFLIPTPVPRYPFDLKSDGQCNGITQKGKRCQIPVSSTGAFFCKTHEDQV